MKHFEQTQCPKQHITMLKLKLKLKLKLSNKIPEHMHIKMYHRERLLTEICNSSDCLPQLKKLTRETGSLMK